MSIVLACVDFSESEPAVVEAAVALAVALGGELHVLHVGAPDPDFVGYGAGPDTVRNTVAAALRDEHRRVEELAAAARLRGVVAHPHLVRGAYAETILREAERVGAGMIVLGSHGHGRLYTLLVGSVAAGVLRGAKVPVLVVPRRP
jgi:nucleotide-binding universal stress UspA family protein